MLPYISFFGFEVQTYSLLAAIGLIVTAFVAISLGNNRNIKPDKSFMAVLSAVAGIFIGGHILFTLTNVKDIFDLAGKGELSFSALMPFVSGMVFYGGLFGAIAAVLIYTNVSKEISKADVFDVFAVSVPLFHAFGRVGCFFAGCCYGVESEFGIVTYLNNSPTHYGIRRFPVALFEAFANLLIFVLLLCLFKKKKLYGKLVFLYLGIYAVARFVLEYFRGDKIRGFALGFSTSQLISLLVVFFLVAFVIYKLIKKSSNRN